MSIRIEPSLRFHVELGVLERQQDSALPAPLPIPPWIDWEGLELLHPYLPDYGWNEHRAQRDKDELREMASTEKA